VPTSRGTAYQNQSQLVFGAEVSLSELMMADTAVRESVSGRSGSLLEVNIKWRVRPIVKEASQA